MSWNGLFLIAVLFLAGNIVWQGRRLLQPVLHQRAQQRAIEALVARGIIRRITWTVGGIHPKYPDMILIEGDGWCYEPFMPAPEGHHRGVTPAEVVQIFQRFGPNSDDALRLLYRLQTQKPGIKCGRLHHEPGMTTMMGVPALWNDFVPARAPESKVPDRPRLH